MVRATLENLKTQTRRVVTRMTSLVDGKRVSAAHWEHLALSEAYPHVGDRAPGLVVPCDAPACRHLPLHHVHPIWAVGDRLWLRENWAVHFMYDDVKPRDIYRGNDGGDCTFYRADGHVDGGCIESQRGRWRPSIHMPRWACRILRDIAEVRVERVQEISPEDAIAEGLACLSKDQGRMYKYGVPDRDGLPGSDDSGWPWHEWRQSPVDAYAFLWDQINAERGYPWAKNDWVWPIGFKRIET